MPKALVLAPGDVIDKIKNELVSDGIKVELDPIENVETVQSSGVAETGDSQSVPNQPDTGGFSKRNGDHECNETPKSTHNGSDVTSGDVLPAGSKPTNSKSAEATSGHAQNDDGRNTTDSTDSKDLGRTGDSKQTTKCGNVDKRATEGNVRGDMGVCPVASGGNTDRGSSLPSKEESGSGAGEKRKEVQVLTRSIASALLEHASATVDVVDVNSDKITATIIYVTNSAGKSLGLTQDMIREQNDVLSEIKRKNRGNKKTSGTLDVIRIESEAKLTSLFPVQPKKGNEQYRMSGVGMVTNKMEYVSQATVLFTSPTGDTNWKKVAREATKNVNIRAYVHDPEKNKSPPHDALLTLVRSL